MTNFHMHPYSKSQIDRAGEIIRTTKSNSAEYKQALKVINEWRTSHAYPINTFVATLRRKVSDFDSPLVAQRLKRLPTIVDKLSRQPEMNLSRMQDIGGVRAVVNSVKEVRKLEDQYKDKGRFSHELVRAHDYIESPKSDGYRGVHLIFKYDNTLSRNSLAEQFKGLALEVQLRTKLQHTWATTVEAMGTLRNEAFKSDRGDKDWLEFFALVSSAFAHVEKQPVVSHHEKLTMLAISQSIKRLESKLSVLDQMQGLAIAANAIHTRRMGGYYNIIELNKVDKTVTLYSFKKEELERATTHYAALEASGDVNKDRVLVSAGHLNKLKLAYPNYFLDVRDFVEKVRIIIEESV